MLVMKRMKWTVGQLFCLAINMDLAVLDTNEKVNFAASVVAERKYDNKNQASFPIVVVEFISHHLSPEYK